MQLLEGKKIADEILRDIKEKIKLQHLNPGLAVILIGQNEASELYVRLKGEAAQKIGINFQLIRFSEESLEREILDKIAELNGNSEINGIIVQLPLPKKISTQKIIDAIDPEKDADGFHPQNLKLFSEGNLGAEPVFPKAIVEAIKSTGEELKNKKGIIICNSADFGKTMQVALGKLEIRSDFFLAKDIAKNIQAIKNADIVVTACGKADLINGEMLKNGAIVIDGGISKKEGKVVGDVNLTSTEKMDGYITPVPGGVGPITIACLLENVYKLSVK